MSANDPTVEWSLLPWIPIYNVFIYWFDYLFTKARSVMMTLLLRHRLYTIMICKTYIWPLLPIEIFVKLGSKKFTEANYYCI